MSYTETGLWKRAFVDKSGNPTEDKKRDHLANAYASMWDRVTVFAKEIAKDVPNLTLHDESHFNALWERADLLAGENYELNPLEVFVFGAAILLHDAGNTIKAYKNGVEEIFGTPEGRDCLFGALQNAKGEQPSEEEFKAAPEPVREEALFNALRLLHAKKAKELAFLFFEAESENRLYLLDDAELRKDLGELIGLIAASHHWDITELDRNLKRHQGAPAAYTGWTINPIRLACMLRCSDAIQIDQARAPSFSYALLRLKGLSEHHWRAQNRLAPPIPDPHDPQAIIFTSLESFKEKDVDAWWIAHDAIAMANTELESCYRLMSDLEISSLKVNRIRDAESPIRLAAHVQTTGWRPIPAEIRIGDPKRIISLFGGEYLYGQDPTIPLRELIQNASDAVRARNELETIDGIIRVILRKAADEESEGYWLDVEDNGIGMSELQLTKALLEFGTSYWNSDLMRRERPGLLSRGLKQTGQFGIGFYSVLMITNRIVVASRKFDDGAEAVKSLIFREGISLRPLLVQGATPALPMTVSTRVSLHLTPPKLESILRFETQDENFNFKVVRLELAELIGSLCPCVDCDVVVDAGGSTRKTVHRRDWYEGEKLEWMRRIFAAQHRGSAFQSYLETAAPLSRPLDPECPWRGIASIGFREESAGAGAIGGLFAGHGAGWRGLSSAHVGCISVVLEGPRRMGGNPDFSPLELANWATEQAQLCSDSGQLNLQELYNAARYVSRFGGDPMAIAVTELNGQFTRLPEIYARLLDGDEIRLLIDNDSDNEQLVASSLWYEISPSHRMGFSPRELEYTCPALEMPHTMVSHETPQYDAFADGVPLPNSFLGCLVRYCRNHNRELVIEKPSNELIALYSGKSSEREGISPNMELRQSALVLRLAG